jgi:VWFA-related protein
MPIRRITASLALWISLIASPLLSQTPAPSDFTLHTQARAVLTDVTVIDANGNPVHNLSRSAFHIFDDKKPQDIASFEEHTGAQSAVTQTSAPSAPHTFSNDYLLHPPPAFNVIVLNTDTIDVVTQMYLYKQLTDFINALPPQNSLAIFVHGGEFTLLLQNFTTDHALLRAAIRRAVPVIPMPEIRTPAELANRSYEAMHQIAVYLGQLPGRKNVLWFSAGSALTDPTKIPALDYGALRIIYDELEASRIALYPIDVRGVEAGISLETIQMDEEAKATGGHALYASNGLAQFSLKTIATDADFYTLSYSPRDFKQDNKWHNVKVTVDGGPYTLSYRTGYFGDGANTSDPNEVKKARILLTSNGEKLQRPGNYDQPIIFHAEVQPSSSVPVSEDTPIPPEKKNETSYTIRYIVPAADFVKQIIPGGQSVEIGAGLVAFNQYGRPVGKISQKFTLSFNGDKLSKLSNTPNSYLYFDQQFTLPKGQDYLFVAVWDTLGGRIGTIQIPVNVAKRVKASNDNPDHLDQP